jgi:ribosomal protein S5
MEVLTQAGSEIREVPTTNGVKDVIAKVEAARGKHNDMRANVSVDKGYS